MLFLALQIGNELFLPDTVFLERWRLFLALEGCMRKHAGHWNYEHNWRNDMSFPILARMSQGCYWLSCTETISHCNKDPLKLLFFWWEYSQRKFSLLCENTHCERDTQTCALEVSAFSRNCSSFRTCSLRVCLYLLTKYVIEVQFFINQHRFKIVKALHVPVHNIHRKEKMVKLHFAFL